MQPFKIVIADGCPRFDFHGGNTRSALYQQIDFIAPGIAPEVQIAAPAAMIAIFQCLNDHHILKQVPPEWMAVHMALFFDTKQIAGQANIIEIELGYFYLTFRNIGVPWPQLKHHITGFQQRQPTAGGRMGYSHIIAKALEIHQLSDSAGTETDKSFEQCQKTARVADGKITDIRPLQIDIRFVGKHRPAQCQLAALARPGDGECPGLHNPKQDAPASRRNAINQTTGLTLWRNIVPPLSIREDT